jgi:hypothetical protein
VEMETLASRAISFKVTFIQKNSLTAFLAFHLTIPPSGAWFIDYKKQYSRSISQILLFHQTFGP